MALIACPECGREISDKAAACPQCGNPIRAPIEPAAAVDVVTVDGVVTTQETGKGWKAVMGIGLVLMLLGMVACSQGATFQSMVIFIAGCVTLIVGRIGAWWFHD